MDCRVKPGNDSDWNQQLETARRLNRV